MEHLQIKTLGNLPPHVTVPQYDPRDVRVGVAHLGGTSNFFASNIAPFLDSALNAQAAHGQDLTMGVVAIKTTSGPLPPVLRHRMEQDGLYTVIGRNGHDDVRVVGAVREVMNYSETSRAVIERLADPKIAIITITATQAGYVLNKDGNGLDTAKPEVLNDIKNPWRPVTVPGIIVAAMALREQRGIEPPVIISCDNLPGNGTKLGNVLRQYAEATQICRPAYMEGIATPNTMVDRITPKQDFAANQKMLTERHGVVDLAPVITEGRFSRLIIEQPNAVDVRLAPLVAGGVKVVRDIGAHEDMKIRGLNGAHLALGLVGTLVGKELVHEAMAQPVIRPFIARLLDETAKTVKLPSSETRGLREEVTGRFDNAEMPDKLQRLLTETSGKVSARLVNYPAIRKGNGFGASAFAVAAWIRYMQGEDENGNCFNLADTRSSEISNRVRAANFDTREFLLTAGAKIFDPAALGPKGKEAAAPYLTRVDQYYQDICKYGIATALEKAFGAGQSPEKRPAQGAAAHDGGHAGSHEHPSRPAATNAASPDPRLRR